MARLAAPTPAHREPPLGTHPRQARGIEKRRRVFEEAMRAYARHGVAGARVEDIVAEAGVGWGTFFNYFPRKEDVLLAAAIDVQEAVEAVIGTERARGQSAPDVIATAYQVWSTPSYTPALHAAVVREVMARGERYEAMVTRSGGRPLWRVLAELLEEGQREGTVRDDVDAAFLARLLNSAMLALHARVGARGEVGLPADADLHELTATALQVLWEGIGDRRRTTT